MAIASTINLLKEGSSNNILFQFQDEIGATKYTQGSIVLDPDNNPVNEILLEDSTGTIYLDKDCNLFCKMSNLNTDLFTYNSNTYKFNAFIEVISVSLDDHSFFVLDGNLAFKIDDNRVVKFNTTPNTVYETDSLAIELANSIAWTDGNDFTSDIIPEGTTFNVYKVNKETFKVTHIASTVDHQYIISNEMWVNPEYIIETVFSDNTFVKNIFSPCIRTDLLINKLEKEKVYAMESIQIIDHINLHEVEVHKDFTAFTINLFDLAAPFWTYSSVSREVPIASIPTHVAGDVYYLSYHIYDYNIANEMVSFDNKYGDFVEPYFQDGNFVTYRLDTTNKTTLYIRYGIHTVMGPFLYKETIPFESTTVFKDYSSFFRTTDLPIPTITPTLTGTDGTIEFSFSKPFLNDAYPPTGEEIVELFSINGDIIKLHFQLNNTIIWYGDKVYLSVPHNRTGYTPPKEFNLKLSYLNDGNIYAYFNGVEATVKSPNSMRTVSMPRFEEITEIALSGYKAAINPLFFNYLKVFDGYGYFNLNRRDIGVVPQEAYAPNMVNEIVSTNQLYEPTLNNELDLYKIPAYKITGDWSNGIDKEYINDLMDSYNPSNPFMVDMKDVYFPNFIEKAVVANNLITYNGFSPWIGNITTTFELEGTLDALKTVKIVISHDSPLLNSDTLCRINDTQAFPLVNYFTVNDSVTEYEVVIDTFTGAITKFDLLNFYGYIHSVTIEEQDGTVVFSFTPDPVDTLDIDGVTTLPQISDGVIYGPYKNEPSTLSFTQGRDFTVALAEAEELDFFDFSEECMVDFFITDIECHPSVSHSFDIVDVNGVVKYEQLDLDSNGLVGSSLGSDGPFRFKLAAGVDSANFTISSARGRNSYDDYFQMPVGYIDFRNNLLPYRSKKILEVGYSDTVHHKETFSFYTRPYETEYFMSAMADGGHYHIARINDMMNMIVVKQDSETYNLCLETESQFWDSTDTVETVLSSWDVDEFNADPTITKKHISLFLDSKYNYADYTAWDSGNQPEKIIDTANIPAEGNGFVYEKFWQARKLETLTDASIQYMSNNYFLGSHIGSKSVYLEISGWLYFDISVARTGDVNKMGIKLEVTDGFVGTGPDEVIVPVENEWHFFCININVTVPAIAEQGAEFQIKALGYDDTVLTVEANSTSLYLANLNIAQGYLEDTQATDNVGAKIIVDGYEKIFFNNEYVNFHQAHKNILKDNYGPMDSIDKSLLPDLATVSKKVLGGVRELEFPSASAYEEYFLTEPIYTNQYDHNYGAIEQHTILNFDMWIYFEFDVAIPSVNNYISIAVITRNEDNETQVGKTFISLNALESEGRWIRAVGGTSLNTISDMTTHKIRISSTNNHQEAGYAKVYIFNPVITIGDETSLIDINPDKHTVFGDFEYVNEIRPIQEIQTKVKENG